MRLLTVHLVLYINPVKINLYRVAFMKILVNLFVLFYSLIMVLFYNIIFTFIDIICTG